MLGAWGDTGLADHASAGCADSNPGADREPSSGPLNVVGVLLGVLLVISGIFYLIRIFDSAEQHRVWLGVAGLVLVVGGLVLIRHLNLTVALVGLVIGVSWVVQGLSAVIIAFSGGPREHGGWWALFGVISLIAGIVVMAMPSSSVTVLAVLAGIWFIVIGLADIAAACIMRHAAGERGPVTHDIEEEAAAR